MIAEYCMAITVSARCKHEPSNGHPYPIHSQALRQAAMSEIGSSTQT
ncbi:hypothetical protein GIV19_20915 [Pseudomonas syringae]|nr:hypothetical protein [Pseudomonas syringae]MCF5709726.1 hypothetical protein [Pseudomonas syringae]